MIYDYYLSEAKEYTNIEIGKKKNSILNKLKENKKLMF